MKNNKAKLQLQSALLICFSVTALLGTFKASISNSIFVVMLGGKNFSENVVFERILKVILTITNKRGQLYNVSRIWISLT